MIATLLLLFASCDTGGEEVVSPVAGDLDSADEVTLEVPFGMRPTRSLDSQYAGDPDLLLNITDFSSALPDALQVTGDGTLGEGLTLTDGGLQLYGAPLGLAESSAWTLSFRMRVSASTLADKNVLMRCNDRFTLRFTEEGWVRLWGPKGTERVQMIRHSTTPDEWHQFTVVWDPIVLRTVRVTVDGQGAAIILDQEQLMPSLTSLPLIELGPDGIEMEVKDVVLLRRAVPSNELFRRTGIELDPWEQHPPLESTLPLPTPALDADELAFWGVTDHLAAVDGMGLVRAEAQWQQLDLLPGPIPIARTTHTTIALGGGRILLFASEARDTHLPPMRNTNDAWILDLGQKTWTELEVGAEVPEPRCHQAGAFDPATGVVFYPGGFRNDGAHVLPFGDIWGLRVAASQWVELSPKHGDLPVPWDNLVFFRPASGLFHFTRGWQLLTWSPKSGRFGILGWLQFLDPSGEPLEELKMAASMSHIHDPVRDRTYAFGGGSKKIDELGPWAKGVGPDLLFTNRTWVLDTDAITMRLVDSKENFSPRVRGGAGRDPRTGTILYYGGVRDQRSQRFEDLWAFDPETEQWSEVRQANHPGPRGGFYGMPFDDVSERFVLTHGRSSTTRFHDDTWLLDYDTEAVGEGRWLFDRRSFPELDQLVLRGTAVAGASVVLSLSAGPSASELSPRDIDTKAAFGRQDAFVEVTLRVLPGAGEWGLKAIEFTADEGSIEAADLRICGEPYAGK